MCVELCLSNTRITIPVSLCVSPGPHTCKVCVSAELCSWHPVIFLLQGLCWNPRCRAEPKGRLGQKPESQELTWAEEVGRLIYM